MPMFEERKLLLRKAAGDSSPKLKDLDAWLEAAPFPIISVFDFLWWTNFSLKWQHVELRVLNGRDTVEKEVYQTRIAHFYNSESFQLWAMQPSNHALKMPQLGVWTSYKLPLKEFIFAYTADEVYLRTKEKEGSFRHDALSARNAALTETFHVVSWGVHSLSRCQLRNRYGEQLLRFFKDVSAFDAHPEFFDEDERRERIANPIGRRTLELKCRCLLPRQLVRGRSVLDLGACLGAMGQYALFHGAASYTAVEVQPDFVRRAERYLAHWGPRARVVRDDTRKFLASCGDGSFDVVICAGVLHCFLEPLAICVEVQRVARHAVVVESIHPNGVRAGVIYDGLPIAQLYSNAPVNVSRSFASLTGVSTIVSSAALKLLFE